ncbi:hypothetical protein ASF29_21000 [Rhizobium sp. Leaf262]|nr:hypothetical protein ASF29_21000 [Rhizobium sp. Leaf262]
MPVGGASTFLHVAIADQTVLHASIAIAGKPEENGATDAIVANGENAEIGMSSRNGVRGMIIAITDGDCPGC